MWCRPTTCNKISVLSFCDCLNNQNDEHEIDTVNYATRRQNMYNIQVFKRSLRKDSNVTNLPYVGYGRDASGKTRTSITYIATDFRDHFSFFATCFSSFFFDCYAPCLLGMAHCNSASHTILILNDAVNFKQIIFTRSCLCHFCHISATNYDLRFY